MPDPGDRTPANAGVPRPLRGAAAGAARSPRHEPPPAPAVAPRRSSPRPRPRSPRRLPPAPSRPRSGPRRPDLTIVTQRPLRRPARRSTASGSTLDMVADQPPARHEDQALLLRPRVPVGPARHVGFKLTWSGGGSPRARGLEEDRRPTRCSSSTSATRLYSGKTATLPARLRPRRRGRRGDPATSGSGRRSSRSRSGRSPRDSTPGSTVRSSSRPATRSQVESGAIPAPTRTAPRHGHLPDAASSPSRCRSSPTSSATGRARTRSGSSTATSAASRSS